MRTITTTSVCVIILLASILFTSCGTNKKKSQVNNLNQQSSIVPEQQITPPFKKLDVPFESFEVNSSSGGDLSTPFGTTLHIPSNAFTDLNGNLITTPVKILFREFHSLGSIMASGIPMTFTDGDKVENFESAGMFEMQGIDMNGNPIKVAEGKKIDIDLASFKQENDYNFYAFDKDKGKWTEISKAPAATANGNIPNVAKGQPQGSSIEDVNEDVFVPLEVTNDMKVYNFAVDYKKVPSLSAYNGVMWAFTGDKESENPEKNKWIFDINWTSINLVVMDEKNGLYKINFEKEETVTENNKKTTKVTKEFKTTVSPALKGKMREKFITDIKKKEDEQKQYLNSALGVENNKKAADMVRAISVSGFGIFNCDRYYNNPDAVAINPEFLFDGKTDPNIKNIYLLAGNKAIIRVMPGTELTFALNEKNRLVAVGEDESVYSLNSADFKKINLNSKTEKISVPLKKANERLENSNQLDEFITKL